MGLYPGWTLEFMPGPHFQKWIGLGMLSGPQGILRFPGGSSVQPASTEKNHYAREITEGPPEV